MALQQSIQPYLTPAAVRSIPQQWNPTWFRRFVTYYLNPMALQNQSQNPVTLNWTIAGTATAFGTSIQKVGADLCSGGVPTPAAWDTAAYLTAARSLSFQFTVTLTSATNQGQQAVGLATAPAASTNYTNLNFCLMFVNGAVTCYEAGTAVASFPATAYASSDVFTIKYDGSATSYFKNGALLRSVLAPGLTLAPVVCLYQPGSVVANVALTEGTTTGYQGVWDATYTYAVGAETLYGNAYWKALVQNTNSAPSPTNTNWQVLGTYSLFQGAWSGTVVYVPGAEVTYSGNYWVAILQNTNSAPSTSNANWQIAGPATLDNVADGTTYNKTLATAVTAGQVDLSKAGVINKTLTNIADAAGRYAVTNAGGTGGVSYWDTNNNPRVDFTQSYHIGKTLANMPDGGSRFAVVNSNGLGGNSYWDPNNNPRIDFTGTYHIGKTLTNVPDGTSRFAVANGAGLGGVSYWDTNNNPRIDFTQSYHIGKTLTYIPDGASRFAVGNAPGMDGVSYVDGNNNPRVDFNGAYHLNVNQSTMRGWVCPVDVGTTLTSEWVANPVQSDYIAAPSNGTPRQPSVPFSFAFDATINGGIVDVLCQESANWGNGYFFRVDGRSGSYIGQILKMTAGTWANIGVAYGAPNAAAVSATVNAVCVVGLNGAMEMYVNGALMCVAVDTTFVPNGSLYSGWEVVANPIIAPPVVQPLNQDYFPDGTIHVRMPSPPAVSAAATTSLGQSGTTTTINVGASTFYLGNITTNANSGSVNPGAYGTYTVYFDDPGCAGGAVTYQATTNAAVLTQSPGRFIVGTITTASGGGGTGGGTSGPCFSGNTRIKTPSGWRRFDELPEEFDIVNHTGTHRATLLVHPHPEPMRRMGDCLVTPEHLIRVGDTWRPARHLFFEEVPGAARTVYNLHVCSEWPEDQHYILENGLTAHNIKAS